MAETEGGATQGAEIQEKAKAPEVERISNERVGLTTRLLLGGEAFNPAKTDIKDLKESDPLNKLGASLYLVNKISGAERKAHWESQPQKTFEDQKNAWADQVHQTFAKKLSQGNETEQKAWKDFLVKAGFEDVSKETILKFYEAHFGSDVKHAGLEVFVANILSSYKPENGKIDIDAVARDIDKISWFANIFGKDTSKLVPSLIEGTMVNDMVLRKELVNKANAIQNGAARMNRLTSEESRLLALLYAQHTKETVPPTPTQKKPENDEEEAVSKNEADAREKKPVIVIPKEQLDALKKKKVKVKEDEEITYADLVDKVLNLDTGKLKDDLPLLTGAYTNLGEELKKIDSSLNESLAKDRAVIISPLAWMMMDAIAQKSDELNKQLSFNLQTGRAVDPRKDPLIALHAVPIQDYTKAEEKDTTTDVDIAKVNLTVIHEKSGLKDLLGDMRQNISIHTHQASLGEDAIATPSKEDYAKAELILEKQSNYNWGVLTKTPDGNLNLVLFTSFKPKEGKPVHKPLGVVSPDMKNLYSLPRRTKTNQDTGRKAA